MELHAFQSEQALTEATEDLSALSVDDPPASPTPETDERVLPVANFFQSLSHKDIFEYCLGFDKPEAPALAKDVILISLECGQLLEPPYPLLDMGLHVVKRKEMQSQLAEPGAHSLNILRQIAYHHVCMKDSAHYVNRLGLALDSQLTRFGATRFVKREEGSGVLERFLQQPASPELSPEEEDRPNPDAPLILSPCPIVILNYDPPQHELVHNAFKLSPSIWTNVVANISTYQIAQEQGFGWREERLMMHQLAKDLKIEYPIHQSAGDHAGFSLVAAVQMVMRPRIPLARESMDSAINTAMLYSKSRVPRWGKPLFCTACGSNGHLRRQCVAMRYMRTCSRCMGAGRYEAAPHHIPGMCPW